MMSVYNINNIFSNSELKILYDLINSIVIPIKSDGTYIYDTDDTQDSCTISKSLGRIQASFKAPHEICDKLFNIAKNISSDQLTVSGMTYVEYNNKYGTPNLPPHLDGDSSDFIINYQISSNTSWDIGLDIKTYPMEDNSALVFDPNKKVHWRPHKTFANEEYIKMIFFRLQRLESKIDNSHLRHSLDSPVYEEANRVRDSLINY
jgi:hypothetical protein